MKETYLSFNVSPELSKEYKKLTQNQSGNEQFGLLEIKCPQATSFVEVPYLSEQDNQISSQANTYSVCIITKFKDKWSHTGTKWCDFMVFCGNDYHIQRVNFDPASTG